MKTNDELIIENIPLIHFCIKTMNVYWQTDDDFQEHYDNGLLGLIRGVRNYDEKKGIKLSTFLVKCIKTAICNGIQHNNVKKRVNENGKDLSLNRIEDEMEFISYFKNDVDVEKEVENKIIIEDIIKVINKLDKEKDILVMKMYFGLCGYKEHTLEEIGEKLNVSKQAIKVRLKRAVHQTKLRIRKYY